MNENKIHEYGGGDIGARCHAGVVACSSSLEQPSFSPSNRFLNGLPFVASGTEAKNGGQGGIASAMRRPSQDRFPPPDREGLPALRSGQAREARGARSFQIAVTDG